MKITITNTEEKIRTIMVLHSNLNTGLKEAKAYSEGTTFETSDTCAELYLDLRATGASVSTDKEIPRWQIEKAVEDAERESWVLAQRIKKAREILNS